jgi:hypothetical protein
MADYLFLEAAAMGLKREFNRVGSTTYTDRDISGNIIWASEGDSC